MTAARITGIDEHGKPAPLLIATQGNANAFLIKLAASRLRADA